MSKKLICPMLSKEYEELHECVEEKCAWYSEPQKGCSIASMVGLVWMPDIGDAIRGS